MEPREPKLILRAVWLVVAAVVVFGPGAAAVVTAFEHWPWTNAPMFAASPVSNDLYTSHFVLEKADGTTRKMSEKQAAGMNDWHFRRVFLVKAWGSADPDVAFYVEGDSVDARAARVEEFVGGLVRFAKRKKRAEFDDVVAVRIDVVPVSSSTLQPTGPARSLGRYDLRTGHFTDLTGEAKR